jgi:hypothetical protein
MLKLRKHKKRTLYKQLESQEAPRNRKGKTIFQNITKIRRQDEVGNLEELMKRMIVAAKILVSI